MNGPRPRFGLRRTLVRVVRVLVLALLTLGVLAGGVWLVLDPVQRALLARQLGLRTVLDKDLAGADMRDLPLADNQFADSDLRGADLRGATLSSATFVEADLTDARLDRADLRHGNLIDADLRRASLRGARLDHAWLNGSDLRDADVTGASFSGASLLGADLSTARGLQQAQLQRACGDADTRLPPALEVPACD